jgi:hypothetical protein
LSRAKVSNIALQVPVCNAMRAFGAASLGKVRTRLASGNRCEERILVRA